jgi:hypothetical protein
MTVSDPCSLSRRGPYGDAMCVSCVSGRVRRLGLCGVRCLFIC